MSDISEVKVKQDIMATDVAEIKTAVSDIKDTLVALARLEERHKSTDDNISRIQVRVDKHDTRIRTAEDKLSAQMWIERVIWVGVACSMSLLISKVVG